MNIDERTDEIYVPYRYDGLGLCFAENCPFQYLECSSRDEEGRPIYYEEKRDE